MRIAIKDIMALVRCTEDLANTIESKMILDFSECTQAQFNKEAKRVYKTLMQPWGIK